MSSEQRGRTPLPPAQITLIKGPEEELVNRAITGIRQAVFAIAPQAEEVRFSAESYEGGELMSHASGSLFADEKLLIISDLDKMSDAFSDEFEEYVKNPSDSVWVVAHHRGGTRGQRVLRALKAAKFPELAAASVKNPGDKADLVADEVRRAGRTIGRTAAMALVDALGADLSQLLSASRQLAADSDGEVTPEMVHTFHRGRVETRSFDVAQALADQQFEKAVVLLRQAQSVKVPAVLLVSALANEFRVMALAKIPGLTASEAKVAPWMLEKARKKARRWSEPALGQALRLIADTDAAVKGESRTPDAAIELCLVKIAQIR